jgi:hypothetical protein
MTNGRNGGSGLSVAAACCAMALSILAGRVAADVAIRDEEHGWSATVHDGWRQAGSDVLERANRVYAERSPDARAVYTHGFIREGAAPDGSVYVLVQFLPLTTKGLSREEVAKAVGVEYTAAAAKNVSEKYSDVVKQYNVDGAHYEPDRDRFIINSRMKDSADAVGNHILTAGYLTARGVVYLFCYAPEGSFEAQLPAFVKIIDSVTIDKNQQFVPVPPLAPSATEHQPASPTSHPAYTGVAVTLLIVCFAIVRSKMRRQ